MKLKSGPLAVSILEAVLVIGANVVVSALPGRPYNSPFLCFNPRHPFVVKGSHQGDTSQSDDILSNSLTG